MLCFYVKKLNEFCFQSDIGVVKVTSAINTVFIKFVVFKIKPKSEYSFSNNN